MNPLSTPSTTGRVSGYGGVPIIESEFLPEPKAPEKGSPEWVARYVRHGLKDVLSWLGEDVGPAPDQKVGIVLMLPHGGMVMRPEQAAALKAAL